MIRQFWGKSAKDISDLSHGDPGWRAVEEGEVIPLSMAFIDQDPEVTEEMQERARRLAAEHV
jgi:hypothetical protein